MKFCCSDNNDDDDDDVDTDDDYDNKIKNDILQLFARYVFNIPVRIIGLIITIYMKNFIINFFYLLQYIKSYIYFLFITMKLRISFCHFSSSL